jgi:hypothetical protein
LRRGGPRGRPADSTTAGAHHQGVYARLRRAMGRPYNCSPSGSRRAQQAKGPARFPVRAQLAQFRSFNFPNNLIWPAASNTFVARIRAFTPVFAGYGAIRAFYARLRRSRIAALRASIQATIGHSLKVMMPVGAVVAARVEAARLEIFVRSRTGTDRCGRASR